MKRLIKGFLVILFFPLVLPWRMFQGKRGKLAIVASSLFSFFVLLPLWLMAAMGTGVAVFFIFRKLGVESGVIEEYRYISGTGSMYPTFPKGKGKTELEQINEIAGVARARRYPGGIELFAKRYFGYMLQRGDIVFFANAKTREIVDRESSGSADISTGFVKRVVALPGDAIEIRDGYVYLNGEILSEPYIARARSTYGGEFLSDCKKLTLPDGYIFVMGDNRKGSDDSRFDVGLVNLKDIGAVIPLTEQTDLKVHWRDTSQDTAAAHRPVLDIYSYLDLLNQKRKEAKLSPLRYQTKLEESAKKRAEVMLRNNDFSFEATRTGYTMEKAMREVGYSNIVWGEANTVGYYEADELIDNYFEFPEWKKFLLNPQFQETGIGAVIGEINGCPAQVVVQHLAGYVPPNYKKEDILSWKNALAKLQSIQSGWESLKTSGKFYEDNRTDIDHIVDIINQRINGIAIIVKRMEANQWLTNEEKNLISRDKTLGDDQQALASKLNDKVGQFNQGNR